MLPRHNTTLIVVAHTTESAEIMGKKQTFLYMVTKRTKYTRKNTWYLNVVTQN